MSWTRWLRLSPRQTSRSSARAGSSPRPSRPPLLLEPLEDRTLLAISVLSRTAPDLISDTAAGNVTGPASVSANGRYVVYANTAANLAPNQVTDSKSFSNIFLYDRTLGTTTLVSHLPGTGNESKAANGTSRNPVISGDSNWVAYVSNSNNLVTGATLPNDTYTLSIGATGGTFKLSYGGQSTTIAYNANASTIQSATAGLPGWGAGNVTVTGFSPGPFTITFTGALANGVSTALTADDSGLTYSLGLSNFRFLGGQNEFLCEQYWVFLYNR